MIPSKNGIRFTSKFRRNHWKKVETTPPGLDRIFKTTPNYANELIKKKHNTPATHASRFPSLDRAFNTSGVELEKDKANLETPEPELSILPNGIKVTSEELYEQMAYVGVFVQAGSRFEDPEKKGSSLLVEHAGFKESQTHSAAHFVQRLENMGANVITTFDRELIVYYIETLRDFVPQIMEIMAETVMQPKFSDQTFESFFPAAEFELEQFQKLDNGTLVTELLHQTAYQGDNLCTSKADLLYNIQNLTVEDLEEHHNRNYVGPRITISGASVNHERFAHYASQFFAGVPNSNLVNPVANYSGGLTKLMLPPDNNETEYFTLGFNCAGWIESDEAVSLCLLQKIMGGGQSFSSGGPGKGMYSRVYRQMLCGTDWLTSAETNAHIYSETGIFSIAAGCKSGNLVKLQDKTVSQFLDLLLRPVAGDELLRAKNALKSSIYYNLEHRSLLCEDMGRQVSIYNKKYTALESCMTIDAITSEDITRVVKKLLLTKPTIVVLASEASVNALPPAHVYAEYIRSYVESWAKGTIFE
jgi:processing peptidase subunit alpha